MAQYVRVALQYFSSVKCLLKKNKHPDLLLLCRVNLMSEISLMIKIHFLKYNFSFMEAECLCNRHV